MNWLTLLHLATPFIALIPGVGPFAPLIIGGIGAAEGALGPGTGAQKKAAVLATVASAAAMQSTVDPAAVTSAASDVIDAVIKSVNMAQAAQTKTALTPATPAA